MPVMLHSFVTETVKTRRLDYSNQLIDEMLSGSRLESAVNGKEQHVDEHVSLKVSTKNMFAGLDCDESAACRFELKDTHGEVSEGCMREIVFEYLSSARSVSDMSLYYNHVLSTDRGGNIKPGRLMVTHRLEGSHGDASVFKKGEHTRMPTLGVMIIFDIDKDGSMFVFTAFPLCEEELCIEQTVVGTKTEYVTNKDRRRDPKKYEDARPEVYEAAAGPTKDLIFNFEGRSYTKVGDNLQSFAVQNEFASICNARPGVGAYFSRKREDVTIIEGTRNNILCSKGIISRAREDIEKARRFVKACEFADIVANGLFTPVYKKSQCNSLASPLTQMAKQVDDKGKKCLRKLLTLVGGKIE